MMQIELEFFEKGTIKTLTESNWDVAKPIERIVLQGTEIILFRKF